MSGAKSDLVADLERTRYLVCFAFAETEARVNIELLFSPGADLAAAIARGDLGVSARRGFLELRLARDRFAAPGSSRSRRA